MTHTFVVLAYKESKYLESCIQSVLSQSLKTNVVIATSTPNKYIDSLANKYNLKVYIRDSEGKGIGYDFEYASHCVDSDLITVAHQDDIYDKDYVLNITKAYSKYKNALILFTDYYEIRNEGIVRSNTNLKIKRILLTPLKSHSLSNTKFGKRSVLRLGCSICCPAVTFALKNIQSNTIFDQDLKVSLDWDAWEKLSKQKGSFVFINKQLMGHRVHSESETTARIQDNTRYKEDLEIFKRFWPTPIAKLITKAYGTSEKSNG